MLYLAENSTIISISRLLSLCYVFQLQEKKNYIWAAQENPKSKKSPKPFNNYS